MDDSPIKSELVQESSVQENVDMPAMMSLLEEGNIFFEDELHLKYIKNGFELALQQVREQFSA